MLNTEQLIRAEFDKQAGILVIKAQSRFVRIIGTTIPLSARHNEAVECFSILPFEEDDGLILVTVNISGIWYTRFIYVTRKADGIFWAHYMNNDEKRWNPNSPYITQAYGDHIEIFVGNDRFTTDMNGYEYDVNVIDGDSICQLLLDRITEEEFRSRVSRISEKEALKQELAKKSQLLQETEELLSNAQRENNTIRLDLAAEKENVKKIVDELRQLYHDLSKPFWQRWRILQIRLQNIGLRVFGQEDFFTR